MNTDRVPATIYVALIDEGVDCWRPVAAEQVQDDLYRILGRIPDGERWGFQPGEVVRCQKRAFQDGDGLVAVELSLPSPNVAEAGVGAEPWRLRANGSFADLATELDDPAYSLYMLFFDLLPMARLAHEAADEKLLNRIYGFAEWCFSQPEKELWNAAGVAFYEHLFDEPQHWKEITGRLSLSVMENCWTLWDTRLSVFQLHRLRKLFRERFPEFQPGRESSA